MHPNFRTPHTHTHTHARRKTNNRMVFLHVAPSDISTPRDLGGGGGAVSSGPYPTRLPARLPGAFDIPKNRRTPLSPHDSSASQSWGSMAFSASRVVFWDAPSHIADGPVLWPVWGFREGPFPPTVRIFSRVARRGASAINGRIGGDSLISDSRLLDALETRGRPSIYVSIRTTGGLRSRNPVGEADIPP